METVRQNLGLSRRKICQLLLVDPSAWTRWTTEGGDAPPHIYRALEWYLSNGSAQEIRRIEERLSYLEVKTHPESRKQDWWPLLFAFLAGATAVFTALKFF